MFKYITKYVILFSCLQILVNVSVHSQMAELNYDIISYPIASGIYSGDNLTQKDSLVWSETIKIKDAEWVQLKFGDTNLGQNSYLTISSLYDGHTQRIDDRIKRME